MIESFETGFLNLSKKFTNFVFLYNEGINEEFAKNFNSFSFGISSKMPVYAAVGFSIRKKMPFVLCTSKDIVNSFSILKNLICEANLNVKFIVFAKNDDDLKCLELLENLKVFTPDNPEDVKKITEKMIDFFGPVCLRIKY